MNIKTIGIIGGGIGVFLYILYSGQQNISQQLQQLAQQNLSYGGLATPIFNVSVNPNITTTVPISPIVSTNIQPSVNIAPVSTYQTQPLPIIQNIPTPSKGGGGRFTGGTPSAVSNTAIQTLSAISGGPQNVMQTQIGGRTIYYAPKLSGQGYNVIGSGGGAYSSSTPPANPNQSPIYGGS